MRHFFEEMRRRHYEFHQRHEGCHAIGRGGHRGGPFGGHRGRGMGGDDEGELGGRDFRGGRKLSSSDLQLIILALLEESPRHGYEVIKALDERTNGFYAPSPGMVYPALTYLEEIGHATVEQDGSKKRYSITDEGRAHLTANRAVVEAIMGKLTWLGEKMDRIREVFGDRGRHHAEGPFLPVLEAVRIKFKHLMLTKIGAPEAEQARVARILEEALGKIERGEG
ncbi:PadR family transcriptional regulator [Amantichitinum ursilacus]|uniref:Transcriptional regulator YqjI n=1 Tax=Amantichitinum ursilacus TaxID=857265 RepID=A0A0N0GR67_9NEIS|nr:PadR family transcriptional regulator [Amantichitinum ursilacus]KPC55149.1 Transcriptional regulator YqjI [Amantichitinum ursilacus]